LKEEKGALNINWPSFIDNWKGDGLSSFGFGTYLISRANYAKDKWSRDNTIDLIYGIVKNKFEDKRKSRGRIYLDSKVGYAINDKFNFQTRFEGGYEFETMTSH